MIKVGQPRVDGIQLCNSNAIMPSINSILFGCIGANPAQLKNFMIFLTKRPK